MKINLWSAIFLTQLFFAVHTCAQQSKADSLQYQIPVNNTITYFKTTIGLNAGLYNGPEYVFYNREKENNVFFQNQTFWNKCTLTYDGTIYTDVPMMYDLFRDKVVVQLYNPAYNYSLINEKISDFTLLNHHFVYKTADSLNSEKIKSGLYDQLYNGKSEIIVRRTKALLTTIDQKKTYPETDRMFIYFKGEYYPIRSQHSLISVLKDKKKELKKYISDNNISFKDAEEQASVRVAIYYDKITQ